MQLVRIKAEDFVKMMSEFPQIEAGITEVTRSRRRMDGELLNRVQTVSLDDFLKQVHVVSLDEATLARLAPHVAAIAGAEGLVHHAESVRLRGEL